MKKMVNGIMLVLLVFVLFSCGKNEKHEIILATTTSTDNSGLLDFLIPYFEEDTGIKVKWVAVGTGAALEMGKNKEADILLVHDKTRELEFLKDGYGLKRSDLMYNDFVIVGPNDIEINNDSLLSVMKEIKENYQFVSRGDKSGTHSKELSLWDICDIEPSGDWYIESGQGMGSTLTMTNEEKAFTLTDRSTFLTMKDNLDLKIIYENDPNLFNQYGVIIVMPNVSKNMNYEEANILYEWLISDRSQTLINQFGIETYNQQLFFANAPRE